MGTSAHPSSEALEVIANVMPVRVRIEELCIREFMRIILRDDAVNVRILLRSAAVLHNKFTPMSYIKYVAKDFQYALDGNSSEDLDSENVASSNSVCDLVGEVSYSMTTGACKYCTCHWQRKWNITDSGRSTYELVPTVGQKP